MADLPALTADELAQRLRQYVEGCGGLITAEDVEIARECVRRARRAAVAQRVAAEQLRDRGARDEAAGW